MLFSSDPYKSSVKCYFKTAYIYRVGGLEKEIRQSTYLWEKIQSSEKHKHNYSLACSEVDPIFLQAGT